MKTDQETDSTLIERLKELNCLLKISKLLAQHDIDLPIILNQIVDILPQAFQKPRQTCARIIYQDSEYVTGNFHAEHEVIREPICINRITVGCVEVYFLEKNRDPQANNFLVEEQTLLSAIADQIGMVISKKEAELSLHKAVDQLKENSIQLENKNIALKELLYQIQGERENYVRSIRKQIEESVLPALVRILQNPKTDTDIREYARIAGDALGDISASFATKDNRETASLSPREMEICGMIKRGLSTKEICSLLGLSIQTVEKHRYNIRKKMGIAGKKVNLAVFLREK
jgi:DNA-binding CsgD family transcriptional regulator